MSALVVGGCPSPLSKSGAHSFAVAVHVTYYDILGRIVDNGGKQARAFDSEQGLTNPRVYVGVANCQWCQKAMFIRNLGFPTTVRFRGNGEYNPWRELDGEQFEPPLYVIHEEVIPCW